MANTASDKQISFIRKLVTERTDLDPDQFVNTLVAQRLTGKGASVLIERLLATPAKDATPQIKSNRYDGKCKVCGHVVPAGTGRLAQENGRWITYHLDGQCPTAAPLLPAAKRGIVNELLDGVADGYYAVPNWTGTNDLTFVRIGTNKGLHNPSLKGHRYVRNVVGGKGEMTGVGIDWVRSAIEAIKVDPKGALMLYGQQIGSCGRCGRPLTDEESRKRGIGPECWGKV